MQQDFLNEKIACVEINYSNLESEKNLSSRFVLFLFFNDRVSLLAPPPQQQGLQQQRLDQQGGHLSSRDRSIISQHFLQTHFLFQYKNVCVCV